MSQVKKSNPFVLVKSLNTICGISIDRIKTLIKTNIVESVTETVNTQLTVDEVSNISDSVVSIINNGLTGSCSVVTDGITDYQTHSEGLIQQCVNELSTELLEIPTSNQESMPLVIDELDSISSDLHIPIVNIVSQINLKISAITLPEELRTYIVQKLNSWNTGILDTVDLIDDSSFASLSISNSVTLTKIDDYTGNSTRELITGISEFTSAIEQSVLTTSSTSFQQFRDQIVSTLQEFIPNMVTKIENVLKDREDEFTRLKIKNSVESKLILLVTTIDSMYSELSTQNTNECLRAFNNVDNQVDGELDDTVYQIRESIVSKMEFRTPQILQQIESEIEVTPTDLDTLVDSSVREELVRSKVTMLTNMKKYDKTNETTLSAKSEELGVELIERLHGSISTREQYLSSCSQFVSSSVTDVSGKLYNYIDMGGDITRSLVEFRENLTYKIPEYVVEFSKYDVNSTSFVVNVATFLSVYEAGTLQQIELDNFLLDMIISTLNSVSKQLVEEGFNQQLTEFYQKLNQSRISDLELDSLMLKCLTPMSVVYKSDSSKMLLCSDVFTKAIVGKFVDTNAIMGIINNAFHNYHLISDPIKTNITTYLCDYPQLDLLYENFVQTNIRDAILSLEPTNTNIEANVVAYSNSFIKRIFPEIFLSDSLVTSKLNPILVDLTNHFQIDIKNRIDNFSNLVENFKFELEESMNTYFRTLISRCGEFKTCSARIFNVMGSNTATAITEDEWVIINTALNNTFRNLESILLNDISVYNFDSMYSNFMAKVDVIYPTDSYLNSKIQNIILMISGVLVENLHSLIDSKIESKISRVDGEFNKLEKLTRSSVDNLGDVDANDPLPELIGVSHEHLLMLKDQYRDCIIPLVDKSGGKCISFALLFDPTNIDESPSFIDSAIKPVYSLGSVDHHTEQQWIIDETSKWWRNLDDILNQCSIYNITAIMTIFDFSHDSNSPYSNLLSAPYTGDSWNDEIHPQFLSVLVSHIKRSGCDYILNLGFGSYKTTDTRYKIYPTSGFLRKMIMYLVYTCGVSSNHLSLTATKNSNLYFYNPYCEWKSFDDDSISKFEDSSLIIRDISNGKGSLVVYDNNGKVSGGYAKTILTLSSKCILSLSVSSMKDLVTDDMNINDINIMNEIFSPIARSAIRYFKNIDNNGFINFGDM